MTPARTALAVLLACAAAGCAGKAKAPAPAVTFADAAPVSSVAAAPASVRAASPAATVQARLLRALQDLAAARAAAIAHERRANAIDAARKKVTGELLAERARTVMLAGERDDLAREIVDVRESCRQATFEYIAEQLAEDERQDSLIRSCDDAAKLLGPLVGVPVRGDGLLGDGARKLPGIAAKVKARGVK